MLAKIKQLFSKKAKNDDERFTDHAQSIELLAEQFANQQTEMTALTNKVEALTVENTELKGKFAEFEQKPAANYTPRPIVAGEKTTEYLTDC